MKQRVISCFDCWFQWRRLWGWNFKELLRNKLRLTWGWAEVLSMAHIGQILNRFLAWPELFSLSLLWISLVTANELEEAFLWPIAFSHLCCDTQTRISLHRGARPEVSLRWQDLRLNTCTIVHLYTEWRKIPPGCSNITVLTLIKCYVKFAFLCVFCIVKLWRNMRWKELSLPLHGLNNYIDTKVFVCFPSKWPTAVLSRISLPSSWPYFACYFVGWVRL